MKQNKQTHKQTNKQTKTITYNLEKNTLPCHSKALDFLTNTFCDIQAN